MQHLVRCIDGHVFDAQVSSRCPVCGAQVEVGSSASEFAEASGVGTVPAGPQNRAAMLWAVAGLGLVLMAAAAIVALRSELAPSQPPAPGAPIKSASTTSLAQPQSSTSPASPAQTGEPTPSSDAASPTAAPEQSADLAPPADLQSPTGPAPGGLNSPASSGPIDGDAFQTDFADALSKLRTLAQIDPVVANIAIGIAGLNLFNHGEEQAGQAMLQQAAAANASFAAAALGQQYFGGTKTLRQDYGQARHWFELASHADVPVANYELAVIYSRGLNVRQDLKLAGHYFLAAYHGGFQPVVEIVTAARAGQKAQRELLHRLGLDPTGMGMTVLQYYDARRASDPAGALTAIQQLADDLQWPAPNILAMAQWDGDGGTPDRAAAVKNFLVAASGGAFGALIPVAEASLDGTLGAPNPAQAALVAMLVRLYSQQQSAENMDKLNRVYQDSLEKTSADQRVQLKRLGGLLNGVAPAGSEAGTADAEPMSSNH
jgi:TPR repeat protein